MTKATIFLVLALIVSGVGAARVDSANNDKVEKTVGTLLEKSVADEDINSFTRRTTGFCRSSRCNGYTDKDDTAKRQLKFRFPDKGIDVEPMGKAEVAIAKGYKGYHHGKLKKCKPVSDIYSYSKNDWAMHMQTTMTDGGWPNQPISSYNCFEKCKLEIFNEKGEQLNKDDESEVWVEREGNSGDVFSKIPVVGWSPTKCMVGNALQAHWWKQQFEYYNGGKSRQNLMVDPQGLPVFPLSLEEHDDALLKKEFRERFCALTQEEKLSITERVKKVNVWNTPRFPRGFPEQCDDGWKKP